MEIVKHKVNILIFEENGKAEQKLVQFDKITLEHDKKTGKNIWSKDTNLTNITGKTLVGFCDYNLSPTTKDPSKVICYKNFFVVVRELSTSNEQEKSKQHCYIYTYEGHHLETQHSTWLPNEKTIEDYNNWAVKENEDPESNYE